MSQSRLRIELLGNVCIVHGDGHRVTLPSTRRRALLAYLVLHRLETVDREQLAYLFWPDSEDGQARTNLRRELHHLRSEVPDADEIFDLGGTTLGWREGASATTDVDAFDDTLDDAERLRERGDWRRERRALERAAELYGGDLVPSCYEDWIDPPRQRLRAALTSALDRLSELCEAGGDPGTAVLHAERRVRLDPLDETAYRRLMAVHQRQGNRAAAIHAFHRCVGVLERELGVAPSTATRASYGALLVAEGGPAQENGSEERHGATPLVGRAEAVAALAEAWELAKSDGPAVLLVSGEAGIGKTRLVEEFVRTVVPPDTAVVRSRAYASENHLSYGLAVEWLRSPAVAGRVAELPSVWRAEIARLAPDVEPAGDVAREPPDTVPASWQRRRLLEAVARAVLAARPPRLLIVDDLHWADADSLEALHLLTRLEPGAALMVVATVRTEELQGNAPLERLLLELRADGRLDDVELDRFGSADTERLARQVADGELDAASLDWLQRISEGIPLFIVETLRAGPPGTQADGEPTALPPRVRAVLATRLGQLSADARSLAELGATIGRAFHFDTLLQASDLPEEALVRALDELWRRHIVMEEGADAYDFSHDALREAAYDAIDPPRRRQLHRRVARALERLNAGGTGPVGGRLAQHLELGGETARAVDAYRQAAREAATVFSHEESLRLLEHARALLDTMAPSHERDRRELDLQLARIIPARSLGGYTAPLTAAAAERAAVLADRLHDPGSLYHALRSLQTTRFVSGRFALSLELSERLQELARHVPDRKAEGDHAMAGSLLTVGDLEGAVEHFERAERGYDPTIDRATISVFGADLAVFTAAWQAHALWMVGLADRAGASSDRALRLADTLAHPYSRALAHAYAALFHHLRRDRRACRTHAREATDICERHGFAYYVHWGRLLGAWADTNRPDEARLQGIRGALEGLEREGAAVRLPIYLSLLGLTEARAGRTDEARSTLERARACAEETGELWWTPEILRLQALLAEPGEERLDRLRGALESALRLKARPLAARAATGLAVELRSQGRPAEARAVLERALEGSLSDAGGRDRRRAERCLERLSR